MPRSPVLTLVLGATGYLGSHAAAALTARGVAWRGMTRTRSGAVRLRRHGAEVVTGTLDVRADLDRALDGCRQIVHLAGLYPRTSQRAAEDLHRALTQQRHLLDAAAAAGVRRLIYVSSTATVPPVQGRLGGAADRWSAPPPSVYHRIKWHLEELALAERRFEVVVACPSGCLGPGDLRIGTSALLVAIARGAVPALPTGWVSLVDVRDVGLALAELTVAPTPPRRTILSAGSYRLEHLIPALAARYGNGHPLAWVDPATARAAADVAERRWLDGGPRPPAPRELIDLILEGGELEHGYDLRRLGLIPRGLDLSLNEWDTWARRARILPSFPSSKENEHGPSTAV